MPHPFGNPLESRVHTIALLDIENILLSGVCGCVPKPIEFAEGTGCFGYLRRRHEQLIIIVIVVYKAAQ